MEGTVDRREGEGTRWSFGTTIVQENYHGGHVITVFPVTVVQDEPDLLVLYTAAGSTRVDGTMRDRPSLPLAERMAVYLDPAPQPLEERPVRSHVLTLNLPGAFHSVWLFWAPNWEFLRWYVNLQRPFVRTAHGIAHGPVERGDLYLDIVVKRDLSWSWKDNDEFDAACEAGLLSQDERRLALDEGRRMIEQVERRGWPFDEPWPEWRPDPTWPTPHLRLTSPRSWTLPTAADS